MHLENGKSFHSPRAASVATPRELQEAQSILEEEMILLKRLVFLIAREKEDLLRAQSDGLVSLAEEKNGLCMRLQALHESRFLKLIKGDPNDFLADNPALQESWFKVMGLVRDARDLNAVNGRLLAEFMKRNQAALTALQVGANNAPMYDNIVKKGPFGQGRTLCSA